MKRYSGITSAYIKSQMQKTSWQDHHRIDDVIALLRYMKYPPRSFTGSIHFASLQSTYRKEYLALLAELDPESYSNELKKSQKNKTRLAEQKKEQVLKEKKMKEDWIQAGGKA